MEIVSSPQPYVHVAIRTTCLITDMILLQNKNSIHHTAVALNYVNMVNMIVNTYNVVDTICTVDMDGSYRSNMHNMYNGRGACVYHK